jgi:Fur family ferric uptake transcriptional regulator
VPPTAKSTAPLAGTSRQIEDILHLLRAKGGRATASRRTLLKCLFEDDDHHSAEELSARVQATNPEVSLSTIYRNLDELEKLGVVVHAHLGHGAAMYHLASDTHGHLVCESCGYTVEAPKELFLGLTISVAEEFGFTVDPRHFAVLGRCSSCA